MSHPALPVELWFKVMHYLDYHELTTCESVCQQFRDILKHNSLDAKLFRLSNTVFSGWPAPRQNLMLIEHGYGIHPVLVPKVDWQEHGEELKVDLNLTAGDLSMFARRACRGHEFDAALSPYTTLQAQFCTVPPVPFLQIRTSIMGRNGLHNGVGYPRICYQSLSEESGITVGDVFEVLAELLSSYDTPERWMFRCCYLIKELNESSGEWDLTLGISG